MDLGPYSFRLFGRCRGVASLAQAGARRVVKIEPADVPVDIGAEKSASPFPLETLEIAELPDAYATHQGGCITRDSLLIEEISRHLADPIATHRHLRSLRPLRKIKKIPGPVVCLATPCQYNYYHWMVETLPKLHLFRLYADLPPETIFYVENHHPFQRDSLRLAGLNSASILNSRETSIVQAKTLFAAAIPRPLGTAHPWAVDWLRRTLTPPETEASDDLSPIPCVVVSRRHAKNRRIVNEDEILSALASLRPIAVTLEKLSLVEQIRLFSRAKILIAPHGAGLANLIFARRGGHVVEIFTPGYHNTCYERLAGTVGCRYTALFGGVAPDPDSGEIHMRVDVQAIRDAVLAVDRIL